MANRPDFLDEIVDERSKQNPQSFRLRSKLERRGASAR
jgi:hypothetical protein